MEDSEIIALYEARNELAIEATAAAYGKYCTAIAVNILTIPEDSEECVSDTYHAVWNRIPPAKPDSLRHYLGTIVRNLALSRYRKNHAQKRYRGMELMLSELSDCIPDSKGVEDTIDGKELSHHIERWLRSLHSEDRRVFLRRYWYGDSVRQLAEQTDRSENAVSLQLLRLRKKLKIALEKEGIVV